MKPVKPKRLAREVIYRAPWFNLYADRVLFPGGKIIERHHFLDFVREAVATVVENEKDQILFVHSYRYTLNSIELEIPAGGIEKGESPLQAGKREVLEESGYKSKNHKLLYTFHPINGLSNKIFHIVKCKAAEWTGSFDTSEVKGFRWISRKEIKKLIRQKKIRDGFTLTALLLDLNGLA